MGVQEIIAALPTEVSGNPPERDLLRTELVQGIVGFIPGDASVVGGVLQVDPADAALGGVRKVYVYGDVGTFVYDADDETTAHDGVFCLVLIGGCRYKIIGAPKIGFVLSAAVETPPDPDDVDPENRPSFGDAYLVLGGTWDVSTNSIAVWSSLEGGSWQEIEPAFGPPLYVVDTDGYKRWTGDDGWKDGVGSGAHPDQSIPHSAFIWDERVANQELYAPPGSRVTGATPTMPLGGTAANINDNNDSTTATTSAIGDKTGAAVADRIVAQLALAEATDLIAIEVRQIEGSAASTSNAMGLYYSTDGTNWTQAGSGFTLGADPIDVIRTGDFEGVTHIAVVTEDKNWASNTHTIAGLNGYDGTVECSVGDAWIVGANPFGALSGHTGKIVVCEVADELTIYTPKVGQTVFDIALDIPIRWNGTQWKSAAGSILLYDRKFTADNSGFTPNTGGDSLYEISTSTPPSTSCRYSEDTVSLQVESVAGRKLRFGYSVNVAGYDGVASGFGNAISASRPLVVALFRDDEENAVAWLAIGETDDRPAYINVHFVVDVTDDDEHEYLIRIMVAGVQNGTNDGGDWPNQCRHRLFEVMEIA